MNNLFDMTKKGLQTFLVAQGMKKFRADQIFHYVYKENIFSWDEMVLLPKKDRQLLKDVLPIHFPESCPAWTRPMARQSSCSCSSRTAKPSKRCS